MEEGFPIFPSEPAAPWLATILLPAFSAMPISDASLIASMETCLGLLLAEQLSQRA